MKPKEPQKQNTDQAGPAHRMLERLVETLSRSVDQTDPDIGELEGLVDEARALLELYRAARAAQPAATTTPPAGGGAMSSDPIRGAAEWLLQQLNQRRTGLYVPLLPEQAEDDLRAALAAPTPPADEQDRSQLSDGYHTFAELYEHRHSLMLAFMASRPDLCWFSKRHADGQLPFGSEDWFIVGANLPTGLITYHLPIELFSAARKTGADELPVGMEWDGHTANDVAKRLREWVEQRPGTQNAMIFARSVLEGWANYGRWVWPESALEGVKRDTTEAIKVLNDALSGRSSDSLVTPADPGALTTPHPRTGPLFLCPEVGVLLQSTEQQGGGVMDWKDTTSYQQGDKDRVPKTYTKKSRWFYLSVTRCISGDPGGWYLRTNIPGLDMVLMGIGDDPAPAQRNALKAVENRLAELAHDLEEMKDD